MRPLLRLVLPLGLLAALAVPTGALAQVTVSTNNGGGLALLASSPTARDSFSFTGDTHSNTTIDNVTGMSTRALSLGDRVLGNGIPGGTSTIDASPTGAVQAGGTVLAGPFTILPGPFTIAASPTGAIQAGGTIAAAPGGATESGNTVTITTTAAHNLWVGHTVTISGAGVAGYNGTFTVTSVPTATSFTYTNPIAGLAASGGGTAANPIVTITTTATHNLQVGQTVTIAGVGVGGYNGSRTVASVPTATTFTYTNPTTGLAGSGGGTATGPLHGATQSGTTVTITTAATHNLSAGQTVTVAGVGVGGYNGSFTVDSAPTATTFTYTTTAGLATSGGGTATSPLHGARQAGGSIAVGPFTIAAAPGGATESGNDVTITTTTAHNLQVGNPVTIAGVADAGYNGSFTVASVPTATTFTYSNPTSGLAPSGGGTATGPLHGASESGNTATITTNAAHRLEVGQFVTIAGVAATGYNGTFVVTSVPTATTFTYTNPISGLATSGGGTANGFTVTITTAAPHNFHVGQNATIAGVGVGGYNGTFAVTSVPTPTTFTYTNTVSGLAISGGGTAAGPARITTTAAHGLSVGSNITVSGVGVAGYNGSFLVTAVPSATEFEYTTTAGQAASGGGTVSTVTTVSGIGTAANATIDPLGLNNSILWAATVLPGSAGNGTTVTYNDPGGTAATPLGASVAGGDDITINLARGEVGANAAVNIFAGTGGVTESGNTVTVTTAAAHNLQVGRTVTLAGVGVPDYNGTFVVTAIPTTTEFTYTNPTAGLAASGGGTATGGGIAATAGGGVFQTTATVATAPGGAVQTGGAIAAAPNGATAAGFVATITTTAPHGLSAGQTVTIAGVGVAGYNGNFTVASVPTSTTFTFTAPNFGLAASGGGDVLRTTITTTAAHGLSVGSSVTISGVGDAGYNGTYTILSVPNSTSFTYANPTTGLAASGDGSVLRTTVTTVAAHGLSVGSSVTITGVADPGANATVTVTGVPTTTTFNFTTAVSIPNSGGGSVYTATTTGTQLITAVTGAAGEFAPVAALVTATASGTVTGRVAAVGSTPLTGGADDTITLNQPAAATASGVALQGSKGIRNTDMAFWGETLVQGNNRGLRIFDISNPASPALLSNYSCNGASGDVSIWGDLVFRSIDTPQSTDDCAGSVDQWWQTTGGNHTATQQSTRMVKGFEGIRIIDISDPTNPTFVKGIATDCGSFTHTIVPDTANNRVFLYVSSFPNAAIDATASAYGNTCEQLAAGSPAPPAQVSGHDKISIIEVPLGNPSAAAKVAEIPLGLKGYNSFFSFIGGYTGDYNNNPGYKGCHDIAVFMPTDTAAAACVTEGVTLDISDPAAPTVKNHFVNPDIDLCATGVYRWVSLTQATTPNCMWGSATFTWDGSKIIWGNLASGHGGCNSNSTTVAHSCNPGGNTNASVDRFYDGQSLSNECETGAGTAPVRSPLNRGAFWMNDADDPSWPSSQFKIPFDAVDASLDRYDRYSGQGCSASLGNVVPVNGKYVVPMSWHAGGIDVVDWTNPLAPSELGWFDVDTSATEAGNANGTNRPAGDSALKSNAWAAYWYNGYVYASYDAPQYGSWNPAGSRGLEVFQLNDASVAGAFDLPHLNPQTQESKLTCAITISGSPKVGKKKTVKATVKIMGQGVKGAVVKAKTHSYNASKTTPANGQVSFSFKPNKKAKELTFSVAAQPNMVGCSKKKKIAK